MKTKRLIKNFGLPSLLLTISLLLVTCKKEDPCKGITCQNGGTSVSSGNTCTCNCPAGYEGEFCQTKSDFLKCKINGVDYQSVQIIIDTLSITSGTYKRIATSGNASDSEIIILHFRSSFPTGTYHCNSTGDGDFVGWYIQNGADEYYSTSGTLTLTNVTNRYEGTFNFSAFLNFLPQDSAIVTTGSFSIKK